MTEKTPEQLLDDEIKKSIVFIPWDECLYNEKDVTPEIAEAIAGIKKAVRKHDWRLIEKKEGTEYSVINDAGFRVEYVLMDDIKKILNVE